MELFPKPATFTGNLMLFKINLTRRLHAGVVGLHQGDRGPVASDLDDRLPGQPGTAHVHDARGPGVQVTKKYGNSERL